MKVNVSQKLKGYKGEEIQDTFRELILVVLNQPEQNESAESKLLSFQVSVLVTTKDNPELDAKMIAHIIEKAEKHANPLGLGRIKELLE